MSQDEARSEMSLRKVIRPYRVYLIAVTLLGFLLVVYGLTTLFAPDLPLSVFVLLLMLATVASIATTSTSVSQEAGVTYHVHNAISFAAVPFFGPAAATLIEAVANASAWLIKPKDEKTWKKNGQQLLFNTAMMGIAIFLAGHTFLLTRQWLAGYPFLSATLPWFLGAIVYSQANLWLLAGILYLQHGRKIRPLSIWRENAWYQLLDIILMSVGGAILAFAAREYDWVGIVVFFLPIILSSLAFRLYVRQMQEHMDNLEEIVEERTQELRELNKEKDAFLAVLTHDMKTPLTSIGLYAGMIQQRPEMLMEKPEMTEIIARNHQVLLEIVNNILDLEKLESSGTMPVEKEEFELVAVLQSVIETLRPQAENKEINLYSSLPTPPLLVYADPTQIERILRNLVSNAVKYTPDGGTVEVEVKQEDAEVICRVIDDGYGIPAGEVDHIFERYRRVSKHRDKAVGTGLGLAVTEALVEAYGGQITVDTKEGEGSTFTVRLPIVRFT